MPFTALLLAASLALAGDPKTVPEAHSYERTSSHAEVLAFLDQLQAAGAAISVETIGTTTEGRPLPLVIASEPMIPSPEEARRLGRPVVYVQANIHAGEVEGKEAALMVLRDLTLPGNDELLRKIVLLVVPDYNPDGNDRFGPITEHRRGQNGPQEVGVRANAQGFDLNRDCMKAESREFQALLEHVLVPWDPDLAMDLHTTDGSYHGYPLTYSPPLVPLPSPNPSEWVRDRLLPDVRKTMREQHRLELFDYGNFDQQSAPTRFETFEYLPRYFTNYIGARGRMAVLSEAYAYAPFQTRIEATYHFVRTVLAYVAEHAEQVRALNRDFDLQARASLAVRCEMDRRSEKEAVLVGDKSGDTERATPHEMEVFDRFRASREVSVSAGFVLPESMRPTVDVLLRHGIAVERVKQEWKTDVEVFTPRHVQVAARAYQGHKPTRLEGDRKTEARTLAAGTYFVSCRQPLGVVAFYLLDPESEDGVLAWQIAGFEPKEGEPLPYGRTLTVPPVRERVR